MVNWMTQQAESSKENLIVISLKAIEELNLQTYNLTRRKFHLRIDVFQMLYDCTFTYEKMNLETNMF